MDGFDFKCGLLDVLLNSWCFFIPALIVGRDGGVILIHKGMNHNYVVKQCQDFIPANKEQDCRLASGTEIREVTRQQIVSEISRILQLPRFKPETSEEMSKLQRAEQMKLFRCADNLSMLKYEIFRRQQFGQAYGFFKEDLLILENLLKQSEKRSCSEKGINRIQSEIDSINKSILNDIIAMIDSNELHIISAPEAGKKSKETLPLGSELANGLVKSTEVIDGRKELPEWNLERDSMSKPLFLGFKEAFKHCESSKRRLPTIAELGDYAGTKGANYQGYGDGTKGIRIGSVEVESIGIGY